jgi:predicted molibdopterin-dependent oxidoreductase YjgC
MIRKKPDRSIAILRTPLVTFRFDGRDVQGHAGESVLAALMRAGVMHLRDAPNDGAPRGGFCLMGLCQECAVRVDGGVVEGCRVVVSEGLEVTRA